MLVRDLRQLARKRKRGSVSPGMNLKSRKGGAVPTTPWQAWMEGGNCDLCPGLLPTSAVLSHRAACDLYCIKGLAVISIRSPEMQDCRATSKARSTKMEGSIAYLSFLYFLRKPTGSKAGHLERRCESRLLPVEATLLPPSPRITNFPMAWASHWRPAS